MHGFVHPKEALVNSIKLFPELIDKNSDLSPIDQAKLFIEECHNRGIMVMVDLPSCGAYDLFLTNPELFIKDKKQLSIENIYVCNKETGKLEEYNDTIHDESYLSTTVYFSVSELDGFYGDEYILGDGTRTEKMVLLEVSAENSKILLENGFYKDFLVGNVVEIQSSNWVYMDANFYYIIGVKYGEIQYLNAEDGLQNIVDMMDKERSLF